MELGNWYDVLTRRYEDGDIDRRSFLGLLGRAAGTCGVLGLTTSFSPAAYAQTATVKLHGNGGTAYQRWAEKLVPEFEAQTGVPVEMGTFTHEMAFLSQAQIAEEGTYNFFSASEPRTALQFRARGLLQEVDPAQIPRLSTIAQKAVTEFKALSSDGLMPSVPYSISGNSIVYNINEIERAEMDEKGANILLDPQYAGRISGEDDFSMRIWYGALQTGQDPNNITDMDAVWDKVRESRGFVLKYWGSPAEGSALLTSGETVVQDFRFSALANLRNQGVPVAGWPDNGIVVNVGSFAAMKGSPMELFYEMVDILLRPEVQIDLALASGMITLLNPNLVELPLEVQQMVGFDREGTLEGYTFVDPVYWGEHADEWQREYTRIAARG